MEAYYFEMLPLRAKPKEDESLTSILTRIGERNHIKTFTELRALLFPSQDSSVVQRCVDLPPIKTDKLCIATNIPVEIILGTTFYYLAQNFGRSTHPQKISRFLTGSIAKSLRYCPQCLANDPYYRLSWRFNHITSCNTHKRILLERCECCRKEIPLFAMPPKIAVCPYCEMELWKVNPGKRILENETDEKAHQALQMILQPITNWHCYEHANLTKLIGARIREYRQGKGIPRREVMQKISSDISALSGFETGNPNRALLNFEFYLTYLNALGLTLYDVLTQPKKPYEEPPRQEITVQVKSPSMPPDMEKQLDLKVSRAIKDLTDSKQRVTTRAIARLLNVSPSTLYRNKRARDLLVTWQVKIVDHERRLARLMAKLEAVYEELSKNGIMPQNKDIRNIMGTCVDYNPEIREWLQSKRRESKRFNSEDSILKNLDGVIQKLIHQGRAPTNKTICKEFGISHHTLQRYSQVRLKLRRFRQTYHLPVSREEGLILQINKVRKQLKKEGIKETQAKIANHVYLSVPALRKYKKIRQIMDEIAKASKRRGGI